MASSMCLEANFWKSQSNQFDIWQDIRETYGSAIIAMPSFPSGKLDDYTNSTTLAPAIHASGLVTQVNLYLELFVGANAYQLFSRMLSLILNVCHKPRNRCWQIWPTYKDCG